MGASKQWLLQFGLTQELARSLLRIPRNFPLSIKYFINIIYHTETMFFFHIVQVFNINFLFQQTGINFLIYLQLICTCFLADNTDYPIPGPTFPTWLAQD